MYKFWIVIFMCWISSGIAQDFEQQFAVANQSYNIKEYAVAIEQYESILEAGQYSSDLYYNLGNAYYRTDEVGKAILSYERASLLAPNDADIQHNLAFTQEQLRDEIEPLPPFFLLTWWNTTRDLFSSTYWSILTLVFFWIGMLSLVLWQVGKQRGQRKFGFAIGFVALSVSLIAFALMWDKQEVESNSGYAIILSEKVVLKSAPDAESSKVITLHAGTKVQLLDKILTWNKIQLADGQQGWLPETATEEI